MGINFLSSSLLIKRLKKQSYVTFLFGSALTALRDGIGIPNVTGMIDIIKSYAADHDLLQDYEEHLAGLNEQDIYQESFSFISGVLGANSVKDIVKNAVMSNFDHEKQKHRIPSPVEDFISIIERGELNVKNIITTNFDTLIEEQLKNRGIPYNSYSIVSDSNFLETDDDRLNIFHIHGAWDRGDSMHTRNQLEASRGKIESSLKRLLGSEHVVIMGYSGWEDSFTRSLVSIIDDDKAEYNVAWCFYEQEDGVIERGCSELFKNLKGAIVRDRISFFKGVDCTRLFKYYSVSGRALPHNELAKSPAAITIEDSNRSAEFNFYTPENKEYFQNIRLHEQKCAVNFLKDFRAIFVESSLGFGFFGFVSSLINHFKEVQVNCFRVDMAEVISKSETENRIQTLTGSALGPLIYQLAANDDRAYIIIFDNIRANADEDTLNYLFSLSELIKSTTTNIYVIFSSGSRIRKFDNILIKLNELTWHETMIVIQTQFGASRFKHNEVTEIHEKSEGVIEKLKMLMYYLEDSSTEEVLEQEDILNNAFYHESIPSTMRKQIELLSTLTEKRLTFKMLKLLSVLKNGETLSNLRKSHLGLDLNLNNTKELINLELATSNHLDNVTTIIKVNPIIKDYVLSYMLPEEIYEISQAYLGHVIIEGKDGIKISSVNRKIYDIGYNTEEDNANTLLRINISKCKLELDSKTTSKPDREYFETRLRKLLYLSHAYIYSLENSSRFNELIIAANNILTLIQDVRPDEVYKYYFSLAYAYRMKSDYVEAARYLDLTKKCCPDTDKAMLNRLYTEELYILRMTDIPAAMELARRRKNEFKRDEGAFIISEYILNLLKPKGEKIKCLIRLERKARKHQYHTIANNLLLNLTENYDTNKKLSAFDNIMKTDTSNYNLSRAIVFKLETLVESGMVGRISDADVDNLIRVYNYLFRQQFDGLFNQCYDVLWAIAKSKKQDRLLVSVFFKAIIMWKLNFNDSNEKKYNELTSSDAFSKDRITVFK